MSLNNYIYSVMHGSRKYSYQPKVIRNSAGEGERGGGGQKAKKINRMFQPKLEFHGGLNQCS